MIAIRYVTPQRKPELRRAVAEFASPLAAEHLKKDPSVTAVLVEPADPESWFVAGSHLNDEGLSAFWLDIKITAGTNTKAGTAAFVRHAFEGMGSLLGPACGKLCARGRRRWCRLRIRRPDPVRALGGSQSRLNGTFVAHHCLMSRSTKLDVGTKRETTGPFAGRDSVRVPCASQGQR
jgi:4-oxalocrotonate tautomerase